MVECGAVGQQVARVGCSAAFEGTGMRKVVFTQGTRLLASCCDRCEQCACTLLQGRFDIDDAIPAATPALSGAKLPCVGPRCTLT